MVKIGQLFSSKSQSCPICGTGNSAKESRPIPLRHPVPRAILASLCKTCGENIPWIAYPACRVCGRAERCGDCARRTKRHYEASRCAVRYDGRMKDWLALYKYRGDEGLENALAAMLAFAYERLSDATGSAFQRITAVPLAPERLQDRGFNQAEKLARRLAEWYGLSYSPVLSRLRHTEKQSLKTRRSRITDMKGNFAAEAEALFSGSESPVRLLIVDDVYTTGSTLDECARVLREAAEGEGGIDIFGLMWARS
ncbi:ComF family protein [Cohnella suwonensis]|uniref:ComF family protein n=1 Tax=Cohnella suwonensis TaxID=696072 RepID=A0ABW0LV22_9BACL